MKIEAILPTETREGSALTRRVGDGWAHTIEASDLQLRPGQWPRRVKVRHGALVVTCVPTAQTEAGVEYVSSDRLDHVLIFND